MGKFERGGKFGSGRGRGDRGDRGDRPQMHDATCDDCGRKCQVPFRPTGDKPIYCSDCFGEHGGGSDRSERRGGNRSFGDRGDRQKFSAVCAKCGQRCEVPFRPTGGKPVYCNDCFDKSGDDNRGRGRGAGSSVDLAEVNAKLDRILKLLTSTAADVVEAASKKEKKAKPIKFEDEILEDEGIIITESKPKKEKKVAKTKVVAKKKEAKKKK